MEEELHLLTFLHYHPKSLKVWLTNYKMSISSPVSGEWASKAQGWELQEGILQDGTFSLANPPAIQGRSEATHQPAAPSFAPGHSLGEHPKSVLSARGSLKFHPCDLESFVQIDQTHGQ